MDDVSDELTTEQVAALLSEMDIEAGQGADRAVSVHYFRRLFEAKFAGADTPRLVVIVKPLQPAVDVDALDVDFVRRAFYFWIYRLYDRLVAQPDDADLRRLISFLSDRIDMLLFLDAQVELALDRLGPAPTFATIVAALTDALSGPPALDAIIAGREDATRMLERSPQERRRRHRALRRDLSRAGRDRRRLGAVSARGGARVPAAAVAGVPCAARPGHRRRRHRRLSPLRRLAIPVGVRRGPGRD